jgi:hypothetical protein
MTPRRHYGAICLGGIIWVQGCVEVLGYDEPRDFDVAAGSAGGSGGGTPCASASDCPGVDDACKSRTCDGGTCSMAHVSAGTMCNQTGACDGAGECKFINGIACQLDTQCFSSYCVDGVCCNSACNETCRACSGQNNNGVCTPIAVGADPDNECANGACNGAGACIYENGEACSTKDDCVSGFCVAALCCPTACITGEFCASGECACLGAMPQVCGDVCTDLAIDEDNCGNCGKTCMTSSNEGCVDGICEKLIWALWPMPNPASTSLPNPSSYDIHADKGVVTDKVTKLMWQRNAAPGEYTWEAAKTYCAELEHAGFDDWRLPTRIELVSLVDFTTTSPAIDTDAFPDTPSDVFWSSSPWAGSPSYAWDVHFHNGYTNGGGVSGTYRVRCVR